MALFPAAEEFESAFDEQAREKLGPPAGRARRGAEGSRTGARRENDFCRSRSARNAERQRENWRTLLQNTSRQLARALHRVAG